VHATIERQVRRDHQKQTEAKAKLLDHYKAVMMARRAKKITEEWKEKQWEKKMLFGEEIALD
jgi:hypothetical protein